MGRCHFSPLPPPTPINTQPSLKTSEAPLPTSLAKVTHSAPSSLGPQIHSLQPGLPQSQCCGSPPPEDQFTKSVNTALPALSTFQTRLLQCTLGLTPSKVVMQAWQCTSSYDRGQHYSKVTSALGTGKDQHTPQSNCCLSCGWQAGSWWDYRPYPSMRTS